MDKQETRSKVFIAAADLFAANGYYHVSVREICDAAGVTKPVLYYYFKDKEDLLAQIVTEVNFRFRELLEKYTDPEFSFEKNLDGIFNVYKSFAAQYPYLIKLTTYIQFSPLPQNIKNLSFQQSEDFFKYIISIFTKSNKEIPSIKKSEIEMLILSMIAPVGMLIGRHILLKNDDEDLEKNLKKYFKFWKNQILKNERKSE